MDVKKLAKEIEEMYINNCNINISGENRCMALDQQELAIVNLCLEEIGNKNGYDKEKYITRDLFILYKEDLIGKKECKDIKIAEQPLKFKKSKHNPKFSLEYVSEIFLLYYAVIIFYANDEGTKLYSTVKTENKSKRHYFKIYAWFACICPKIFNILFFNQIHLFITSTCDNDTINEIKEYLESTEELWREYNYLIGNEGSEETLGKVITKFLEIMEYNNEVMGMMKVFERIRHTGFLAMDYKNRDTHEGVMLKKAVKGIKYFQLHLSFLKEKLSCDSDGTSEINTHIEHIQEYTEQLEGEFCELLIEQNNDCDNIEAEIATDMVENLKHFEAYCADGNTTKLINA